MRFTLLRRLDAYLSGDATKRGTRIEVNYNTVKSIPMVKPTLHKYLYGHIRSSFLRIDAPEAFNCCVPTCTAIQKTTATTVWSRSRRGI